VTARSPLLSGVEFLDGRRCSNVGMQLMLMKAGDDD
jgi:hypothetical protein